MDVLKIFKFNMYSLGYIDKKNNNIYLNEIYLLITI